MEESKSLATMVAQEVENMKKDGMGMRSNGKVNLAELSRRTGISRQRLRTLEKGGFEKEADEKRKKDKTKSLTAHEENILTDMLRRGIVNSVVMQERLREITGYNGSRTTVWRFIDRNRDKIPARRKLPEMDGCRRRRFETGPGEMYQMDWGFVNATCIDGSHYRLAVFAMICHHCGRMYIEFFPNARQENLFAAIIHAFLTMGMPETILTDNMASVVTGRHSDGSIKWNSNYDEFQRRLGFSTRLCKPRHAYTKGQVERLVRFVKENFVPARGFTNITDLNNQAWKWCEDQNSRPRRGLDEIPLLAHSKEPLKRVDSACMPVLMEYLAPERRISADGFINYDGRKYGVPASYSCAYARAMRLGEEIIVYDRTLSYEIARHVCDWSSAPHYCEGQFNMPEEKPTAPVRSSIIMSEPSGKGLFSEFDFIDADKEDLDA